MTPDQSAGELPHSATGLPAPHANDDLEARQPASRSQEASSELPEELREHLRRIDDEIGALQIEVMKPPQSRPWFRDPNTLTAVLSTIAGMLAFLLSFTTTFFQYQQNQQQNIHDSRTELRGLILRLSALPRENILYTQTITDTFAFAQLSSLNQAENAVLAKQAAEIMATIPAHVTASEYLLVANALMNSSLPEQALELLGRATLVVKDSNDGVAVLRSQGRINFLLGDVAAGRAAYQQALAIFDTFPTTSAYYRDSTHALTELTWADAEFTQGFCAEASQHFQRAQELARLLEIQGIPNQIMRQVEASRRYIEQCRPRVAPTAAP